MAWEFTFTPFFMRVCLLPVTYALSAMQCLYASCLTIFIKCDCTHCSFSSYSVWLKYTKEKTMIKNISSRLTRPRLFTICFSSLAIMLMPSQRVHGEENSRAYLPATYRATHYHLGQFWYPPLAFRDRVRYPRYRCCPPMDKSRVRKDFRWVRRLLRGLFSIWGN